jgi:large conductance mechanosensitive channel
MLKEFRDFIARGNVLDLAVAVIMGGAFGKVVSSLVNDVLMPPIGRLMGGVSFSDIYIPLDLAKARTADGSLLSLAQAKEAGVPTINIGLFINAAIDFIIVAFVVFMIVKAVNRLQRKKAEAPAPPPEPTPSEKLLGEIRDLMKAQKA